MSAGAAFLPSASLWLVMGSVVFGGTPQEIADLLKETMSKKYGVDNLKDHFADTRDTLCYATNDNQDATYGLLDVPADFAIVIGGYNSSNTGHIAKLCEQEISTYFISSHEKIISDNEIIHFDLKSKSEKVNPYIFTTCFYFKFLLKYFINFSYLLNL